MLINCQHSRKLLNMLFSVAFSYLLNLQHSLANAPLFIFLVDSALKYRDYLLRNLITNRLCPRLFLWHQRNPKWHCDVKSHIHGNVSIPSLWFFIILLPVAVRTNDFFYFCGLGFWITIEGNILILLGQPLSLVWKSKAKLSI